MSKVCLFIRAVLGDQLLLYEVNPGPTTAFLESNCLFPTRQSLKFVIRLAQSTISAVADHVLNKEHSQPHEIHWESVRILGRAQERRMKEAMLIYQRHPKMKRDVGMEQTSV